MIYQYLKLKYGREFYTRHINDIKNESSAELEKIKNGTPLHKVLGFINISNLKLKVNKDILIPRYETEELILLASKEITADMRVLDLCTGSGYIALAIKKLTNANVVASDISKHAIAQTKENAEINKLDIEIIQSDLFDNINGKFDIIISNPPYIPDKTILDDAVLNYEPHLALFGGEDGNDFYKRICEKYKTYLKPGGKIYFEMSIDNKVFLKEQGFTIINDINNKPRIAYK